MTAIPGAPFALRLTGHALRVLVTLWVGALWTVGYLAAPVLFRMIPDRGLAGRVAGEMFSWGAWLGIAAAVCLLALIAWRKRAAAWRCAPLWLVLGMLLLTLVNAFGLQPAMQQLKVEAFPREVMETALRERFALLHGISSILYLIESLLGLGLVALQDRALAR